MKFHDLDSPFDLLVSTNEIFATGTGLREAVQGIQSTFRIDVGNLPGKQLEVKIKGMNITSVCPYFSCPPTA